MQPATTNFQPKQVLTPNAAVFTPSPSLKPSQIPQNFFPLQNNNTPAATPQQPVQSHTQYHAQATPIANVPPRSYQQLS